MLVMQTSVCLSRVRAEEFFSATPPQIRTTPEHPPRAQVLSDILCLFPRWQPFKYRNPHPAPPPPTRGNFLSLIGHEIYIYQPASQSGILD